MKKWLVIFLSVLTGLGTLVACGTSEGENSVGGDNSMGEPEVARPMTDPTMPADDQYHSETDYQYSWTWERQEQEPYFQRTSEGILYAGLGRLYAVDETTREPQLCCLRPDCAHHWTDAACTASLWGVEGILYTAGRLYYGLDIPGASQHYGIGRFNSMDLTGADRKVLLQDYPINFSGRIIHRGYLYSYYIEYSEEEAKDPKGKGTLKLIQTSLKDPGRTQVLWTAGKVEQWERGTVSAYGNYLIFSRNKLDYMHTEIFSLNLQTGEIKEFSGWEDRQAMSFGVGDGRILVMADNQDRISFASFSMDFEDRTDYSGWDIPREQVNFLNDSIRIGGDSQYIYRQIYSYASEEKNPELEIMDWQGNKVGEVDVSVFNEKGPLQIFSDPREDGVVIMTSGGRNWGFYYFEKAEVGSGHIAIKPFTQVCGGDDYIPPKEVDASNW